MIGVSMGEKDSVEGTAILNLGEVGELISLFGPHTNASIYQDPFSCNFKQGARGTHFVCTAKKGNLHSAQFWQKKTRFLSKISSFSSFENRESDRVFAS